MELVRTTAMEYSPTLRVLLSPATTDPSDEAYRLYQAQYLSAATEACKSAFPNTVFDAPRVGTDVAVNLAAASNATVIVFQLTVRDISSTRMLLRKLTDRGLPPEAIIPLANRFRKRGGTVDLREAQKAMGGRSILKVCNDFNSAVHGINFGQPLSQAAPRSRLRKDIQKLAVELCATPARGARAE